MAELPPDGRLLPPLMVLRPFMYVEGVKASQFVQHSLTDYTARVATDRELTSEEIDELTVTIDGVSDIAANDALLLPDGRIQTAGTLLARFTATGPSCCWSG